MKGFSGKIITSTLAGQKAPSRDRQQGLHDRALREKPSAL